MSGVVVIPKQNLKNDVRVLYRNVNFAILMHCARIFYGKQGQSYELSCLVLRLKKKEARFQLIPLITQSLKERKAGTQQRFKFSMIIITTCRQLLCSLCRP